MNERERERETRREATARQDFSCHNSLPFSKDFEPRLPSYYYSLLLLLPLQHIYIFRHFIFFSSPFSFHLSPHRPTSPEGGAPTVLRQSGPFELHADHVYKIKWGNTVILGSANYRLNANECLNPRSQPGVCVAFDDVIRPLYPHPLWLIHRRRSDCATKSWTSSRSHFSAWTTIKMNRGKKKRLDHFKRAWRKMASHDSDRSSWGEEKKPTLAVRRARRTKKSFSSSFHFKCQQECCYSPRLGPLLSDA